MYIKLYISINKKLFVNKILFILFLNDETDYIISLSHKFTDLLLIIFLIILL